MPAFPGRQQDMRKGTAALSEAYDGQHNNNY